MLLTPHTPQHGPGPGAGGADAPAIMARVRAFRARWRRQAGQASLWFTDVATEAQRTQMPFQGHTAPNAGPWVPFLLSPPGGWVQAQPRRHRWE